ncbi:MFS transporter [Providencia rettgeri]
MRENNKLQIGGLLALASAAFITLLTEIVPAGLLSKIALSLETNESIVGQFITTYALGAMIAAIPITLLTHKLRRRPLLLFAVTGFAAVNLVTAFSHNVTLSLIARFIAGMLGGLIWSLLAGYAVRMSPPHLSGKAIAISGSGATLALVLGVPLGSFISNFITWQGIFILISLLCIILTFWIIHKVPDFPGQKESTALSTMSALANKNILSLLFIVFTLIVAHNLLYIYIEPFLSISGLAPQVDQVLFVFGIGSLLSLWFTGMLVDKKPVFMLILSILFFTFASYLMRYYANNSLGIYNSVVIWGIGIGGFAAITQMILARLSGKNVDLAQAVYTTSWNCAISVGGISGGILLEHGDIYTFPLIALGILAVSLFSAVNLYFRLKEERE